MGSGESQPHRAIAFGFLRRRSQVVKVISAAKFELEMPKTVILRAMHDQIRAAGRRKQADLGFLSNSDVKKIPNAIALVRGRLFSEEPMAMETGLIFSAHSGREDCHESAAGPGQAVAGEFDNRLPGHR